MAKSSGETPGTPPPIYDEQTLRRFGEGYLSALDMLARDTTQRERHYGARFLTTMTGTAQQTTPTELPPAA